MLVSNLQIADLDNFMTDQLAHHCEIVSVPIDGKIACLRALCRAQMTFIFRAFHDLHYIHLDSV